MDFMYYVVSFILPLVLLALFNAKLILAYRQFRKKRRTLRPTQLNARFVYTRANSLHSIHKRVSLDLRS